MALRRGRHPAVLEPERKLCGTIARCDDPPQARYERLDVDVPDPGDVTAVGDPVVQRNHGVGRRIPVDDRPYGLEAAETTFRVPETVPPTVLPCARTISYSMWESTSVPKDHVDEINAAAVLHYVPCQQNADSYP